ncbi:hypothetical protein LEP1GSC188_1653 [Leptospira weilii serovar Topaz str. LT2116]|uniref:Uncharacterized protein n=1 Tax=Leptospira weilii serovar Topaz str. LT2116 TaxID=1088540 RepID=M3FH13_9LEPT|nr:hypothetical protein LEP1GSC188_1653 [Leptospira weilii serovar Topaz str. LT2116]
MYFNRRTHVKIMTDDGFENRDEFKKFIFDNLSVNLSIIPDTLKKK